MPGPVPVADGRPDEQGQSVANHQAHIYIETHAHTYTYICYIYIYIYVYMRVKIRKKRYFVVHNKTLYFQWVAFLEKAF